MSMLAERKRKTKWIINPTKKPLWTKDSNGIKIGKGIMEKMGWTPGKGLGINEQGIQEPLKVSYKNDTQGMGFKGKDDDWIEYQDEFNCLLNQLRNSNESFVVNISDSEKNEVQSLEEKSKLSKARVHYQKFTRGKDLSKYSKIDLACILGINKTKKEKSKIKETIEMDSKIDNNYETHFGVTIINSGSIQDYFKKKWIFSNENKELSPEDNEAAQNFPMKMSYVSTNEKEIFQREDEKKPKKRKIMLNSEEYVNVEEMAPESDGLKISKNIKVKREKDLNSEEEPHIKRKKNFYLDPVNDDSQEITHDSRSKQKNLRKDLLRVNENNKCDLEEFSKKDKSNLEKDNEDINSLFKRKRKKFHADFQFHENFQDLHVSEKLTNEKEKSDTPEVKLRKKKKKKMEKDEAVKQKDVLEKEEFFSIQNTSDYYIKESYLQVSVKDINNSELEKNASKAGLISKKKKKKSKKEKYFENDEGGDKDSCYILHSSLNSQNKTELTESCLEIESTKKKKKKKDKENTTKSSSEYFENSICQITNSSIDEGSVKSTVEREVLPEGESVKKQKKKMNKEKLAEKKGTEVVANPGQIIKLNLEEKDTKNSNDIDVISGVKYIRKKKKKKDKKEMPLEKYVENLNSKTDIFNFCAKGNKNTEKGQFATEIESLKKKKKKKSEKEKGFKEEKWCNQISNLLKVNEENVESTIEKGLLHEIELVNKKKKKKKDNEGKLVKIENDEFIENCNNHFLKPRLEKKNIKNTNEIEIVSVIESVKKRKKKKETIKEVSDDQIGKEKRKSCVEVKEINLENKEENTHEAVLVQENKEKKQKGEIIENSCENKEVEDNKGVKKEEKTEKANVIKIKPDFSSTNKNNYTHHTNNYPKNNYGYNINNLNFPLNNFGFNNYSLQHNIQDFHNQNSNALTLFNFLYSYNFYNNLLNLVNGKKDGSSGTKSHKVELLNEKRADKFYPGQNQNERILRLIHLSDFTEFKGSNLEKLVGYGCQKQFNKNKPK